MIIVPNENRQVGMIVQRPDWDKGNWAIIRYVGYDCFIGDLMRGGVEIPGLDFRLRDLEGDLITDWVQARMPLRAA